MTAQRASVTTQPAGGRWQGSHTTVPCGNLAVALAHRGAGAALWYLFCAWRRCRGAGAVATGACAMQPPHGRLWWSLLLVGGSEGGYQRQKTGNGKMPPELLAQAGTAGWRRQQSAGAKGGTAGHRGTRQRRHGAVQVPAQQDSHGAAQELARHDVHGRERHGICFKTFVVI